MRQIPDDSAVKAAKPANGDKQFYQRFGFLIHDVSRLLRASLHLQIADLGLTQAQWRALTHLSRMEGCQQSTLAEVLEIRPITLARLLDRLEANGLIERRRHPTDRRAVQLYLQKKSGPILEHLNRLAELNSDAAMRGMTKPDRERLIELLQIIRDNISLADKRSVPV